MRTFQRPPHRFIPSDEDRNSAILNIAQASSRPGGMSARVKLSQHMADFKRIGKRILITYTPFNSKNQQSTDWVNVSTSSASSL